MAHLSSVSALSGLYFSFTQASLKCYMYLTLASFELFVSGYQWNTMVRKSLDCVFQQFASTTFPLSLVSMPCPIPPDKAAAKSSIRTHLLSSIVQGKQRIANLAMSASLHA